MKKKFLSYCLVATGLLLASCASSNPTVEGIEITSRGGVTSIEVGETLQLEAKVHPEGAIQTVTWSSDNTNFATISDTGLVTAVAPGNVMLTATSTENTSITNSFALTVKASTDDGEWGEREFTTHEQFLESEKEQPIKVKGKVTYVQPVSDGLVSYYIQNGTDGYYIYQQDATKFPVDASKSYEVGGFKKYNNGVNEIVDVEYFKESKETFNVTTTDVSNLNFDVEDDMKAYHDSKITIKNATIASKPAVKDDNYYTVSIEVGNKQTSLFINPKNMSSTEFEAINTKFKTVSEGMFVDVVGIMSAFGYSSKNLNTQIVIHSLSDITFPEVGDAQTINSAKDSLYLTNSIKTDQNSITLPTSLEGFEGVEISWDSQNKAIIANDGTVTHPAKTTDVKLVATIKKNQASTNKDIYVTVFGNNETGTDVVTLDFDDGETTTVNDDGTTSTGSIKSGYAEGVVKLGNPKTEWMLRNTLICKAEKSDAGNGKYTTRLRNNKDQAQAARIEVKAGFDFNMLEFNAALFGSDTATALFVEYSTDNGTTWTKLDRQYAISSKTLETIRVSIPGDGLGNRSNVDDIRLIKVN